MPLKTLTCGLFPVVSHTSPEHNYGYIHSILRNVERWKNVQCSTWRYKNRWHDENLRLTKQVICNTEQPPKCDKLTTCTNHMLTWPKMIPEASLKLMYQSVKSFKCHSFQQQWHSEPLNMIHNVILSKLSKARRLTTPLPSSILDSNTKNVLFSNPGWSTAEWCGQKSKKIRVVPFRYTVNVYLLLSPPQCTLWSKAKLELSFSAVIYVFQKVWLF